MSNIATTGAVGPARTVPFTFALSLVAVAGWLVAGLWADEIFLPVALVGAAAAAMGAKAWREARRHGRPARLAIVGTVLGGLVAAQILVYVAVWAIAALV